MGPSTGTGRTEVVYAELHCRSAFSFLEGASSAQELIDTAIALGLPAIALTDVNGLYGVVEAREALIQRFGLTRKDEAQAPLRLHYGSELTFDDDVAVALVESLEGYHGLCQLIAQGRLAAPKGSFLLTQAQLCARPRGLHLLVGGPRSAAMRMVRAGDEAGAARRLAALKEAFGDHLWVELVRHLAPGDRERSVAMARLARALDIPLVATNDVRFHEPGRKPLHDLLRCIREGVTLEQAGRRLLPNAEACLKSPGAMARLFPELPEALANTHSLSGALRFCLHEVRYAYPHPELPPGLDADTFLAQLAREGLRQRLGAEAERHAAGLERELLLIAQLRYAGYFLTMWDVVQVCAKKGILCQGRGSAANSLVCFALGITSVRPDVIDMLFERFLSPERDEPPDIDLDIEHERREEVIQFIYAKYGRDHAAMVCEVIRYRTRSAVREVGKALGFPEPQLQRLSKLLTHWSGPLDARALLAAGINPGSPKVALLSRLSQALVGMPRHLSIHVGGFVLSREPLTRTVPIENGRMADRTVIQWDKDHVDAMGMFKLDLLGLGMLTVLAKAFALVKAHHGVELSLQTVPTGDPATYRMLCEADSVGLFQVESRAQMNMLPRLQPEAFYDLVIQVAIVRPGPIQGQMVHPFLRRRMKQEPVEYPHPKLEQILSRTLGVPLFQEQVMRLAEAVGGYTPGQADQLRRDMASWRNDGRMERHERALLDGMQRSGLSEAFAQRVWQQLKGFGAYGFPESHAAAFAHLAYVSGYLKRHFPVAFACALINSQPMGFYSPSVIVGDLERHGGRVLPLDVQASSWDCTMERGALRLGLRMVRGLGEAVGRQIERAARERPFTSVEDLAARALLPSRALVPLAAAGALRALETRREALWRSAAVAQPLGPLLSRAPSREPLTALPRLEPMEERALDARYAGAFQGPHPVSLLRPRLTREGVLSTRAAKAADPERQVRVAGLVITRQRPGEGHVVYLTLEDETGHIDVSVSEGAFKRFEEVIRLSGALVVRGQLCANGNASSVRASAVSPLALEVAVRSHDFH